MDAPAVLVTALDAARDALHRAVEDLPDDLLTGRPGPGANPLAWLLWHSGRVQDAQVAPLAGTDQVWVADGWAERCGLDLPLGATGYGMDEVEVARVAAPRALLLGYLDAATDAVLRWLPSLSADDLDQQVDEWQGAPVTLGVRVTSVVGDVLQHAGQAGYAAGLLRRSA